MIKKVLFVTFLFVLTITISPKNVHAFRFISWGDTKSGTSTLSAESNQAKALNPVFTLYAGDLIDSWSTSGMDKWIASVNGGNNNGMFSITFPIRGNHDSGASSISWSSYINQAATAVHVGATNYSELTKDTTFSFDYGNSHFVGIDVLGDVTKMSAAQIAWLDSDLTAAENRGLVHAFLYWHGPVYSLAEHCCAVGTTSLISVINKHPIVSATFHGHEHVTAYTHVNASRIPGVTHQFEEFVTGDAGAGPDTCKDGRFDYCLTNETKAHGFVSIDVNGANFTANFYKMGTVVPVRTMTFTKGVLPSQTPRPSTSTTITPTSIYLPGDADGNNKVDGVDFSIWLGHYNQTTPNGRTYGDFNVSGKVDGVDFSIWLTNYGRTS